ncbi:DUF2194 domain-containing protein [Fervidobacterium sp.]
MYKSRVVFFVIVIMFFNISFLVEAKALLLYKGSEQGYGYNILLKYVAPALKNILEGYDALDVEIIDFPNMDLSQYNLIVTCYYSPQMKEAKKYLEKLTYFVLNGGKILIINNLGATMDTSGSNHPGLPEINSLYNLLGISYSFGWKKITPDSVTVNKNYSPSETLRFKNTRDVERFALISPYSESLVRVNDSEGNVYDMAVLSNLGGIISYNYLFDDEGKITIDLSKLFSAILFGNDDTFRFLIVGPENYDLKKAFDYTLFRYDWKSSVPSTISIYDVVILMNAEFPITDKTLLEYISNGGNVVCIGKGNVQKFVQELRIDSKVFPTPPNFKISIQKNLTFQRSVENAVVLVSSNQNDAIVWKTNFGSGQVIYYPMDLMKKEYRGLFIQSVLSQLPMSIQPIINSWSLYLDDFPLPAYNRKIDKIVKEFGEITDNEFYYNVWWPMMKQLAKEFGIKYTTIFVPNYNASVSWPFSFQEYTNTPEQLTALKELLNSSYEIGLHGYNHIPLTAERWTIEQLDVALSILKIFLRNTLGEDYVPYVYVAPDNIIDLFGVERLLKVFPSIKVVGTTYRSTNTLSEFEILFSKVVIIPRTTYGYYPTDNLITNSVLSLMLLGTYQYFLHPDDLFSNDRNPEGSSWMEMYANLKEFLSTMKQYYPFLRNHWSSESGEIMLEFFKETPIIKKGKEELIVSVPIGYHLPRYYYLRVNGPFTLSGGRIVYSYGNLIVVEQTENKMEITKK